MTADSEVRAYAERLPVPEFETTAWTVPPALTDATITIVTTAALHVAGHEAFSAADTGFRVIPAAARDLVLGHWSPNFDRLGFAADHNVVFPIDRLDELAEAGTIGRVAPRHIAFAGNQDDTVAKVRIDSGPAAAAMLRGDGVDIALLTPV